MIKLNAKQLRAFQSSEISSPGEAGLQIKQNLAKNDIYIILDNVLDTYNIGSIFRLADAVAARKVYLCGDTETPPNGRIFKASVNTTEWVDWEYAESAVKAIKNLKLKIKNLQVVAIEQSDKSIPYDEFNFQTPVALVVGHETNGVSPQTLKVCDAIVELQMYGVNISLNVMVSLGIVLYQLKQKTAKVN